MWTTASSLHRANRKTRQKQRRRRKHQEHEKGAKNTKPPNQKRTPHTTSDTSASSSLVKSLNGFLLQKAPASPWVGALQSQGWSPPFLGTVACGGLLPALVRPRHSRNAAGTYTSDDVADQPLYHAHPAGIPVVSRFLGRCPARGTRPFQVVPLRPGAT